MRTRLLVPLMVFALLAVMALAVPALLAFARSRTQEVQLSRAAAMVHIAELSEAALNEGDGLTLQRYLDRFHEVYGESVLVIDAGGRSQYAVGSIDPTDNNVQAQALDALRDLPQTTVPTVVPWSSPVALLAVPIGNVGATTSGAVVLQADLRAARSEVRRSWLLVGALAVALLAGLGAASQRWVRWVLRPVRALNTAANAFPRRRELHTVSSGPPELRQLAASVSRMAQGLEEVLEQQRSFVADASHQLRNPLAAVRLRLDDLVDVNGTAREDFDAVARDLDRLDHIVERMLALATAEHRATAASTGVGQGLAESSRAEHTLPSAAALVEPFRARVAAAGQTLHAVGSCEVQIGCRRSDLEEIVGTLLENACKYAGPGAIVTVAVTPHDDLVEVSVADDGPGLGPEELAQVGTRFWRSSRHAAVPGTGLGLAIVRHLVLANGGTFQLTPADTGGLRAVARFGASV